MKNLEKEYKEQISLETPDLWSRIEAGVDAYEAAKAETAATSATETPAAPVKAQEDNIVKFNSKKFINTLGKISVAAILFLVVAATYNVVRTGSSKSDSTSPAEVAITDYQSAPEATEANEAPDIREENNASEVADATESQDINESPSGIFDQAKEAGSEADSFPTLSPAEVEPTTEAEASDAKGTDISLIRKTARQFDISQVESFMLFKRFADMGLTNVSEITFVDGSEDDSSKYGFDYTATSFSVASFTADPDQATYLLFYRAMNGIDILAVKNDDTGEFIYIKPAE